MRRVCAGLTGLLILAFGCGSDSGGEPIDPVATAYCAECSELSSCERVVNETINVVCTEETRAWYACTTENDCDASACDAEFAARDICLGRAPRDNVRVRILFLEPSANLGQRGTGETTPDNPLPENSIPSFLAAMDEGAEGIQLDVEITQDGQLIIMHDETLDRTTNCTGCVSEMTFDQIRACRLLDGAGDPTDERPPTLLEAYSAVDGNALINVELRVFEASPECPVGTDPEVLVPLVLEEVTRLDGEDRTIFSSLDETAVELIKTEQPGYYSALISEEPGPELVQKALDLEQDAIHPDLSVSAATVQAALDAGLQVNVWDANTAEEMQQQIEKGSTAIITNEPDILADLLAGLRAP